jgi:hypothetical protein
MKVKRLIEELQKWNPEADVKLHNHTGKTALRLLQRADNENIVWIETEDDFDIKEDLKSRIEIGIDELGANLHDLGYEKDEIIDSFCKLLLSDKYVNRYEDECDSEHDWYPVDIVFATREIADETLKQMQSVIKQYGFVSINKYYIITNHYTYRGSSLWGWKSLDSAKVVCHKFGYFIKFPRTELRYSHSEYLSDRDS